jgi:hypothetical protein
MLIWFDDLMLNLIALLWLIATQKTEHTHNSFQKVLHYIVTLIFSLPSAPPSSLCFFLFLSKTTIITHNQPTHCATIFHLLTSLPHFSFQTQTHRKKTKRNKKSPLDEAKEEYTGGGGSGRTTQVSDYFLYNHLHHPLF